MLSEVSFCFANPCVYLMIALHIVDRPVPCYVKRVALHDGGRALFEDFRAGKNPDQQTSDQPNHIDSAQDSWRNAGAKEEKTGRKER